MRPTEGFGLSLSPPPSEFRKLHLLQGISKIWVAWIFWNLRGKKNSSPLTDFVNSNERIRNFKNPGTSLTLCQKFPNSSLSLLLAYIRWIICLVCFINSHQLDITEISLLHFPSMASPLYYIFLSFLLSSLLRCETAKNHRWIWACHASPVAHDKVHAQRPMDNILTSF